MSSSTVETGEGRRAAGKAFPPLAKLEAAIEQSLAVWDVASGAWQTSLGPESESASELAGRVASAGTPLLEDWADACLLAVPVTLASGRPAVAVAKLSDQQRSLAARFAEALCSECQHRDQIGRLQAEVEACHLQISSDFEELTFLRQVAEQLDTTAVTVPVRKFAATILPLLSRSVAARTAVLLSGEAQPEWDRLVVVSRAGEQHVDDDVCREIVRRFGSGGLEPVIENHVRDRCDWQDLPGVENLMLVRVAQQDFHLGWLLLVNRVSDAGRDGTAASSEFGTVEAGVLNTTAAMLATHAHNAELFEQKEQVLVSLVRSLVNAIEAKDPYTCGHSERVALFAKRLAEASGLAPQRCEQIYLTGLLHDVGKIGISDATLAKPGKLTEAEFAEVRRHPDVGWQILQHSEQLGYVFPGVVHHHERFDGRGYPDGLAGQAIPLDARVLAVADAYDAMTSDRPYRAGMPQERVEAVLREGAGTQWDARLIGKFLEIMPEIVRLRTTYRRISTPHRVATVEVS